MLLLQACSVCLETEIIRLNPAADRSRVHSITKTKFFIWSFFSLRTRII